MCALVFEQFLHFVIFQKINVDVNHFCEKNIDSGLVGDI